MRPGFVGGEVWQGLRRNAFMSISVVIVTMVSMFLLGLGLLAQRQADTMKGYWYDRIQVSIYLCTKDSPQPNCAGGGVTDAQRTTIRGQLEAMPEVAQVYYESEQEAYDRFRDQFRNNPTLAENIKLGDIPQSFRVQLHDPQKFAVITDQFRGAPGVEDVQDQQTVLEKFLDIIRYVTYFAVGLAVLMVVCAGLLMSTTIRQAAYVRRREIGIMRLVGASSWTIRMPFVIEMLIVALVGAGLSVGLLYALVYYVFSQRNAGLNDIALGQGWIGTGDVIVIAPWLVLGVVVVAGLTSLVTLRRYLRV